MRGTHRARLWTGRLPLGELPAALARRYGSRVAIEGEARSWTYRAFADEVERTARSHGDLSGRTALLRWSNEPQLLVQLLAHSLAGAVVAPVKARVPEDEVVAIAEATGATVGVAEPGLWLPHLASGPACRGDTAILLCTSGTTGGPKAAALTHGRRSSSTPTAWWSCRDRGGVRVLPPFSLGLPVSYRTRPGLAVRAVDPTGRPLRLGAKGELQFRGPGVMSGYRGRDGGLADGWLSTGDHGRVLPGGLFVLAGRDHDRLKVGGFSVFPAEVEAVLDAAPGVREVAVVGLPDPRLGERPVALVVADAGFDPEAFLAWAGEHVAGYRRPREVYRVEALPRGRNDKLDWGRATRLGRSLG